MLIYSITVARALNFHVNFIHNTMALDQGQLHIKMQVIRPIAKTIQVEIFYP